MNGTDFISNARSFRDLGCIRSKSFRGKREGKLERSEVAFVTATKMVRTGTMISTELSGSANIFTVPIAKNVETLSRKMEIHFVVKQQLIASRKAVPKLCYWFYFVYSSFFSLSVLLLGLARVRQFIFPQPNCLELETNTDNLLAFEAPKLRVSDV